MLTLSLLSNGLSRNFWDEWNAPLEKDWSQWRNSIASYRENEEGYDFFVNLAGFKKEDVEATVVDGVISVTANNKEGNTVSQSFQIPEDGDLTKLDGKLEDGLLTVTIKKVEALKPLSIKIK